MIEELLRSCIDYRKQKTHALFIEGFPRAGHSPEEFSRLLLLFQKHDAKVTFVVNWYDIRNRGLSNSVADMMHKIKLDNHEVSIRFRTDVCSNSQLCQHAAEALHFMQRVFDMTVKTAKVGYSLCATNAMLSTLGIRAVDNLPGCVSLSDCSELYEDVERVLLLQSGNRLVTATTLIQSL
tara:strand:- start:2168 stop:2707 length:540 start_codon:yes stop_codon:yes gene_type:complete